MWICKAIIQSEGDEVEELSDVEAVESEAFSRLRVACLPR
jgi:hypothetical protein